MYFGGEPALSAGSPLFFLHDSWRAGAKPVSERNVHTPGHDTDGKTAGATSWCLGGVSRYRIDSRSDLKAREGHHKHVPHRENGQRISQRPVNHVPQAK